MDFTTVERVKSLNGLKTNEHDALLRQLITSVSKQIETYMSILPEVKERIQFFDVGSSCDFFVKSYPLHSVTEVINDWDRLFTGSAIDSTDYTFYPDELSGLISIDKYILTTGRRTLKITYVGGFAFKSEYYIARQDDPPVGPTSGDIYLIGSAPTGVWAGNANKVATWSGTVWQIEDQDIHFVINNPDIVEACNRQLSHVWQRRKRVGSTQTMVQGNMSLFKNEDLLPQVKSALSRRRRTLTHGS